MFGGLRCLIRRRTVKTVPLVYPILVGVCRGIRRAMLIATCVTGIAFPLSQEPQYNRVRLDRKR